ncbi:unnamed protein product [Nippostrongylus brasiliensis]|uniref:G_PROTEIN_RECEP_F1_2 domain-containing protein n=1 Tax=Nippostrongylus brasiliensis TaxID=27835 RepID=A0A0N4YIN3_NIPBR|nr:unnamed protein product [Nippostrongylus brasiliensis]
MKLFCHDTQWIAKWQLNSTHPAPYALRQYVKWMRAANVALVVVIPLVFLVVLNTMLMYYVKKRSFFIYASLSKVTRRMQREGQATLPFVATLFRRHSDQAPSAVVLFLRFMWDDRQFESNL